MKIVKEFSVELWDRAYCPVTNHLDENASWDGVMFETYGKEVEYVKGVSNEHVWTYMDTDEGTILTPGYHLVNRIGYFITEFPWEDQDIVVIVSKDEDEDEVI